MNQSVNISKITPPYLPKILYRPRLVNLIEENKDKKLILILGQAAQGKTTLAASYGKTSEMPFAWMSLDKDESDPASLFLFNGPIPPTRPEGHRFFTPSFLIPYKSRDQGKRLRFTGNGRNPFSKRSRSRFRSPSTVWTGFPRLLLHFSSFKFWLKIRHRMFTSCCYQEKYLLLFWNFSISR